MKNTIGIAISAALATFIGVADTARAAHCPWGDMDIVLAGVALRPSVTSDIHVHVYQNPNVPCHANTIFAVHGAAGTAATFGPLAAAMFASGAGGTPVCRVAALDLPGHGGSSLPAGAFYGDLTLGDYANAVIESLERLGSEGIHPTTVMGHSQGGLVLQIAQEALLDSGSSLREAFHIKRAILLASVGPRALPWAFHDSGFGPALVSPLVAADPMLGATIQIAAALWVPMTFSNLAGVVPPNAPSPEEVAAQGYASPEAFAAMGELLGIAPFERPEVSAGIFAPGLGTELRAVAFENDTLVLPSENAALYAYLTGEDPSEGFVMVTGEDAVHGMPMSNPEAVLEGLDDCAPP